MWLVFLVVAVLFVWLLLPVAAGALYYNCCVQRRGGASGKAGAGAQAKPSKRRASLVANIPFDLLESKRQ